MNKYFQRIEFACNCGCGLDTVDYEVMEVLVDVRECYDRPVHITSACRCDWWNGKEDGSKTSYHPLGKAVDF